ncbi:AraC family transcriptional regulator [Amycolatopsis anabasis]|uniref:AraC family transcriptional regulator n=1 Tax=Amycolatopsis anabasis TaxID=1840409 RepID=UPI00131AE843|nr:AraC family transcriptional regulator [Amycolatopsis anabasis]
MPTQPVAMISSVSTESVPPAERVDFWEDYNRQALVGLTCSSYSERGLLARQTNLRSGALRIAEITGNEHVIERTPGICRRLPKESVFASLVLGGDAVFFHPDGVLPAPAGSLVLYETDHPYLFGFSSPMRQLLVDIPRPVFTERCLPGGIRAPMVLGGRSAAEDALVSALRSVADGLVARHDHADGERAEQTVLDLIRSLAGGRFDGQPAQLAIAKDYIERHLSDPGLSAERVAAAAGVSARHLRRLFAPDGMTPSRYLLQRRLELARDRLRDATSATDTIADIAYRCGFASQSHFTRVFRDHFGQTPGEARG